MQLFHRKLLPIISLGIACPLASAEVERVDVTHAFVAAKAQSLAAEAYQPPEDNLPRALAKLTYDDYRRIRFRPEESLWGKDELPFRAQFFHLGYLHRWPVVINEFSSTHSQHIPFVRTFFDYQDLRIGRSLDADLNYAGFRLLYPLNQENKWDELVSFLGASYFRALGTNQTYGLSARGLALNAGGPPAEEFPRFTRFWLGRPAPDSQAVTVHALLDSPSATGAMSFVIFPGEETLMEVEATFYFRSAEAMPGFAPMTSMFWYGEGVGRAANDYRPEVHDSDGLLIAKKGDGRIWHPLLNPQRLQRTDFTVEAGKWEGFGLLQRDRDAGHYADWEALYETRPSLWMEPLGDWPTGKIRLVELPTGDEYADNIVAYWTPRDPIAVGTALHLRYRLRWTMASKFGGPRAYVKATHRQKADEPADVARYLIDFTLPDAKNLPANAPVTPEVIVPEGITVEQAAVVRHPVSGDWRLILTLRRTPESPDPKVDARLLIEGARFSETWSTTWEK